MTSKLSLCVDRFGPGPNGPGDGVPHLPLQENGIADLLASGVTVVKIHNCPAYMRWVRQNYPAVTVIGRNTNVDEWFRINMPPNRGYEAGNIASQWYERMRADIEAAGPGVYWCWPYCEPDKGDIAKLRLIALALLKLGVPLVLGEFSAEFNLYDVEDQFMSGLAGDFILGLHAYDNPLPAPGGRKLVDSPFLFPNKPLKTKARIAITELGIDAIFSENRMISGWKNSGLSAEEYAAWLIAADVEFRKDARVIGEAVYISGRNVDDKEKAPFYTSFREPGKGHNPPEPCVDDRIMTYNYALSGPIEVPPPAPDPEPPPVTPPPGPSFPAWYRVSTGGSRLRKRLAPNLQGEIVELQVDGSELLIESIDNGWAKLKGAPVYCAAQYLVRK